MNTKFEFTCQICKSKEFHISVWATDEDKQLLIECAKCEGWIFADDIPLVLGQGPGEVN